MKPHHRMLSAAILFSLFAAPVLADQKHDRKKHAKDGKHAVERTSSFHDMDDNHDGVISRREWRGNSVSFREHDRDGNGVLSGAELQPRGCAGRRAHGAPAGASGENDLDSSRSATRCCLHGGTSSDVVTRRGVASLDRNHDNVISAYEYGVGR